MLNWPLGRLNCMRGRHERSERHVSCTEGERFVSKCRFCGIAMTRRAKRDWIVTPPDKR